MAKKKPDDKNEMPASEAEAKGKPSKKKPDEIENWADQQESDVFEQQEKFWGLIQKAYKNREEADETIEEYWNIYNTTPDDNQVYQGNSRSYIPAVRDAIRAGSKRVLKQLFPNRYKHVEAVGSADEQPLPQLALMEHYIRSTKLKSVVRSILIAGKVTGQWNIYMDWMREIRSVSGLITRNQAIEETDGEVIDPEQEEEIIEDHETVEQGPTITDFSVQDLAIIPPTRTVEKADIVVLKLRMTVAQVEKMVDDGVFILPDDSSISEWVKNHKGRERFNPEKDRVKDSGVKTEGTNEFALVYEATARLDFGDGQKRLAYIYYAGEGECVGLIKAPQWGQKRPILSVPVDRIGGSSYGIAAVEAVKWLQWALNDFWNMGQDSAMYNMMPIIMSDPEKNPNWAMMVLGLAAVWPVNPDSTKFANFPALWKDAVQYCGAIEQRIQQALDINPMMMGQMPAGRKNANQMGAQMQEQSIPVLDEAERFEEEILTPLVERFFEYDCQFRDEDLTILTMGEIGVKAQMQEIPANQWENRYFFQWVGTEYVKSMQLMQQQIATMNVLRGIPPQQLNGRKLDISPILEILTGNVFGSELSGRILIDERERFTVPADIENELMINGIPTHPHAADDDMEHLKIHHMAGQHTQDPAGLIRNHMQEHMAAIEAKRMQQQSMQQGQPGIPGGAAPGVAGTPRLGAMPAMQKPAPNPAGAIHPDQIAGGTPRG